jgi:hypothetical protein
MSTGESRDGALRRVLRPKLLAIFAGVAAGIIAVGSLLNLAL